MNRTIASLLVLSACTVLIGTETAAAATRAPQPDVRFGVYTDASGFALGGGLKTRVGTSGYWSFNPNLEMVFFDYGNAVTINGDFLYDIPSSGGPTFHVGVGPAILTGNSNTDLGVNLIGGLSASRGTSRPFVQMKAILGEGSELAIMGGVRF
jgi:hypothetical protein